MYKNHIVLDLEMNPISKEHKIAYEALRQEVIEIGAVKLDENLNVIDTFDCFVKPEFNYQVTPYITKLTGIKSSSTMNAESFKSVLKNFDMWIGDSRDTRIYSWSDNDLIQLRDECKFKGVTFPCNMKRWLDFQKVFPRLMNISNRGKHMALHEAIKYFDIEIDAKKVHNALYDAEITSELLVPILNGEYKQQVKCVYDLTHNSDENMNTLGDTCGGILSQLLEQMKLESANLILNK